MIIYKTTNNINGKFYIGKHNNTDINYYGSGHIIKDAMKKYGKENFTRETIIECEENDVDYYEKQMIALHKPHYNISSGGEGGNIISEFSVEKQKEIRKKQADTLRGKKKTEEHKKNLRGPRQSIQGDKHPMYGNGYKISGKNNGRHKEVDIEKIKILLQSRENSMAQIAKMVGVSKKTLYIKMDEHGLPRRGHDNNGMNNPNWKGK